MNSVRVNLLNHLLQNQNTFISGEELSQQLDVSRTAIWKHIEELRKEGYIIEAIRKQGYKLISVTSKMTASTIVPHLQTTWLGHELHMYDEVESTQIIAQNLARNGAKSGTIVMAEQQSLGKGRMGRKWHSPPGTGLWMSMIIRPDLPLSSTPQLTLLTSVGILRGINKVVPNLPLGIKWPNDLLCDKRKIAGILTELSAETDKINHVIVGIGLNVNQAKEDFPEELQDKASSLAIEAGTLINRQNLIIAILKEWEELYEMYLQFGFSPIKMLWETYAISLGKEITARTLRGTYVGIALGITEEGVLLLEDSQGSIHKIYSADIET